MWEHAAARKYCHPRLNSADPTQYKSEIRLRQGTFANPMKTQITRISVLQSGKIVTALYALIGCLYAVAGVWMLFFGASPSASVALFYCLMPIVLGVVGFLLFALFAFVYNALAKRLGGIEFEFRPKE